MESDASLSDFCSVIRKDDRVTVIRLQHLKTSESEAEGSTKKRKKRPKKIKEIKKVQIAPYKCQHCQEEFSTPDFHLKHVETAHPVPHACPVHHCSYRTAHRHFMRRHQRQVHGKNSIRCPFEGCEGYFVKRIYMRHINAFHKNKKVVQESAAKLKKTSQRCEFCDFVTESSKMFEFHMKDYHLIGLICPIETCKEKIFADKVAVHFASSHPDIEYKYSLGNGLILKNALAENDSVVEKSNMIEQEKENSELEIEYQSKTIADKGFGGFQCNSCEKSFLNRRSLIRHIARVHEKRYKKEERTKKFACTFENCDKSFKCQTLLDDHLNMHNENYAYECDECSQKFFARARYAVHLSKYHSKSIKDVLKNSL